MGRVKFLCVNCKHMGRGREQPEAAYNCVHPEFGTREVDLVTGEPSGMLRHCRDVRADEALCGEMAKWFEAR